MDAEHPLDYTLQSFAETVRAQRIQRAWTQDMLAAQCGLTGTTVGTIESARYCRAATRIAIAKALEIDPEPYLGAFYADQKKRSSKPRETSVTAAAPVWNHALAPIVMCYRCPSCGVLVEVPRKELSI